MDARPKFPLVEIIDVEKVDDDWRVSTSSHGYTTWQALSGARAHASQIGRDVAEAGRRAVVTAYRPNGSIASIAAHAPEPRKARVRRYGSQVHLRHQRQRKATSALEKSAPVAKKP